MKNLGILKDVLHQANLTSLDVAAVLRESVSAAESILDCATSRPLCDEEHYPLPTNVTGRRFKCRALGMILIYSCELQTTCRHIWDTIQNVTLIFGVFFQKQVSFAARNYEQAVWNMLNRGMWSVEVFTVLESISVIVLDFYGLEHFLGGLR